MYEKRAIYRAIAEVAYAIARAGDGLQSEERQQFYSIINKKLDYDSWAAESRFDILEELHPDPEKAFLYAISELKKHKEHLTPNLKSHAVEVATAVANSYQGENNIEQKYLQRLKDSLDF